jgi:DNA repair protein RadA/Sms
MRAKTSFLCQACGHQSPRWLGRCPDCGGWNSMKEERQPAPGRGRPPILKLASSKATPIAAIEVVGETAAEPGSGNLIECWVAASFPGR